jgi:outer membrane autotransporter protein
MLLRQAALGTCAILGLAHPFGTASYAADIPIDSTPIAEQRVTLPGGNAISVWTDVARIWVEDERLLTASRGRAWQSTTGLDYIFGQSFTIGGGLTVSRAHTTEFAIPGRTETDSVVGFARATAYFLNNFNAGIIGGYGVGETDGFRVILNLPENYSRDSNVAFVGAHVGATFENQGFFVNPSARILASWTDDDFFQTSLGGIVPGTTDDFIRGSLGGEAGYRISAGGLTITPSFRAFLVYDFDLPAGYSDRTAVDLTAALNVQSGNFNVGVEAFTTVGRDDWNSYAFRGYASYRF